MLPWMSRPIRTVLMWQLIATALVASLSAVAIGLEGAISAVLGGLIAVVSGLAAAASASRVKTTSAGWMVFNALKAEGVRVGLMVVLLWVVLANYRNAQVAPLLAAFVISAVIFPMALFVRDRS
jgi:ATP synthase protein I